jgi:hypothetical protein
MHRHVALLVVLVVVVVAVSRLCTPAAPSPAEGRCRHPIAVSLPGRRPQVLCAARAAVDARALCRRVGLRGCGAGTRVRAGQHVVVEDVASCRLSVEGMSGSQKLTLGVPLELNRASETALRALPGIGPVLARRIVEDRRLRGDYPSVDALKRVRGIGTKTVARLRGLVAIDPQGRRQREVKNPASTSVRVPRR